MRNTSLALFVYGAVVVVCRVPSRGCPTGCRRWPSPP